MTSEVMAAMPAAVIIRAMITDRTAQPVGRLLKEWRTRRRLSQLELALEAEISPRHLSFIETGRSTPSRGMLLRLAERLDVPLRERNTLLVAAGYAPRFPERRLDDGALESAQRVVELVLRGHEPFPALAVDRHWNLVARNDAVPLRLAVDGGELAFYSTTTVFGTPLDVTLSELAIEAFFPADERTAAALHKT